MAIEFKFVINPNTITASVPGTEIQIVVENKLAYDSALRTILHAAKPGEQIPYHILELTERPGRQVSVISVFTGESEDGNVEISLMQLFTRFLHQEVRKIMPFRFMAVKLFDQFDYSLEIEPDLSLVNLQRLRDAFFVNFRMRRLTINGSDLTIALWRRNCEYWLRMVLVNVIPLTAMILGYFFMPAIFRSTAVLFLLFLTVVLFFSRFLGKGLWIWGSQSLVSRGYVRNLLLARWSRLPWEENYWMKLLWRSGDTK